MARPKGSGSVNITIPHPLLDAMRSEYSLTSDGGLCEFLGVSRSNVSKFRHGVNKISAEFIIRVHKKTGWPIDRIELLVPNRKK
jgi:predicted transcriptional regulator